MKRASYQNGSVVLRERKNGPDVWEFRYREDGKQKSRRIGTVQKFRTKASAEKEAAKFRAELNEEVDCLTVRALCNKFEKEELDTRPNTKSVYLVWARRTRKDLGHYRVDELAKNLPKIEDWLNGLETLKTGRPLAKKSKLHAKAFLHLLLEFAMKHGHHPLVRNPIQLLKIKGVHTKVRVHTLLTGEQYEALMADPELPEHVKTMITICMLLGLRISEVLGLRWDAIDFEKHILKIQRSSVGKHVGDTKNTASAAEWLMHDDIETVFLQWKQANTAPDGSSLSVNGWLFGNLVTGRPYWRGIMQQAYLIPAGQKLGKTLGEEFRIKSLGWHDFRHTYRAMMGEIEDITPEMQQKLMRHSDITQTFKYGGQREMKRLAQEQAKVVNILKKKRA